MVTLDSLICRLFVSHLIPVDLGLLKPINPFPTTNF